MSARFKWWCLILVTMILFTACATFFFLQEVKKIKDAQVQQVQQVQMGIYGKISNFKLQDQEGRVFGSESLKGSPWVANFIFSRCQGPCPLMSKNFSDLQKILPEDSPVKLVSFTVDPGYDSVEVLEEYADNYNADENRWHFLTGSKEEIYRLGRNDFKLTTEEVVDVKTDFIHSVKMILVDSEGRIRAYYQGTDPEVAEEILGDLKTLQGKA
jgi:protein SCO1/2